ncbi:hypothetical protein HPB48_014182 [Haemaphysalis longicornis]|uniref:Myb/SANT-like DNA-binding domain-containing protein n=1 Tax=Haemaphysalis longicornis TaxID=44386 RepID=A0A9J6FM00_HAELO|nr:hypothetical protein HPB48_014182 [Haemaphysalis longicornis]
MATNADDSACSNCGKDRTKWTDDETRAVIILWQDHLPDLRRAKRNYHVYARIAGRLVALGIEKTVKEVKKKIENLGNLFSGMVHGGVGLVEESPQEQWTAQLLHDQRAASPLPSTSSGSNEQLPGEVYESGEEEMEPADELEQAAATPRRSQAAGRKRAPAPSTVVLQILDEQRQLRCSLEQRRDRELELREQHLQFMQRQEEREEKFFDLLAKLCNK